MMYLQSQGFPYVLPENTGHRIVGPTRFVCLCFSGCVFHCRWRNVRIHRCHNGRRVGVLCSVCPGRYSIFCVIVGALNVRQRTHAPIIRSVLLRPPTGKNPASHIAAEVVFLPWCWVECRYPIKAFPSPVCGISVECLRQKVRADHSKRPPTLISQSSESTEGFWKWFDFKSGVKFSSICDILRPVFFLHLQLQFERSFLFVGQVSVVLKLF